MDSDRDQEPPIEWGSWWLGFGLGFVLGMMATTILAWFAWPNWPQ